MSNRKYVIINGTYPILFSGAQNHSDFATGFGEVTSAGFFSIQEVPYDEKKHPSTHYLTTYIEVHCYGQSVSLGIKSKETDHRRLEQLFNSD